MIKNGRSSNLITVDSIESIESRFEGFGFQILVGRFEKESKSGNPASAEADKSKDEVNRNFESDFEDKQVEGFKLKLAKMLESLARCLKA